MSALARLVGSRVRRIDLPEPALLAITLASREPGERVLLARFASSARAVGLASERPRGDPASSFVRKLRKELAGGTLRDVEVVPGVVTLTIGRRDGSFRLAIELTDAGNVVLIDGAGGVVVAQSAAALRARGIGPKDEYVPPSGGRYVPPADDDALAREGDEMLQPGSAAVASPGEALDRALRKTEARLVRRLAAIAKDAARAEEVPRLRADATALLSSLHAIEAGATEARVVDWTADPPAERTIAIDPSAGPKGTAEAMFHRARRLERGVTKAEERRAETEAEIAEVARLRERIATASSDEAIDAIATEARRLGIRADGAAPSSTRRKATEPRLPFKRFVGHGDRTILVGRGAGDNDALTLRVAKPHDLWLHARGTSGAHVVVPLAKNEACPPELLIDAAHLAAHFSSARGEAIVEVTHVDRRYVRKPRGFPPGAVAVDREKVIALRVDAERTARLLRSES